MRDDPELDVIRRRGFQHEARYLADLRAEGRIVVEIEQDGSIDRPRRRSCAPRRRETIEAMAAGADVIYQATFFDGTFRGHADFLLRVDVAGPPVASGVRTTTRSPTRSSPATSRRAPILQICSYVDQLERIQGVRPEWLHVALGGSARAVETLRVDDYMAYYRSARDRFLATLADRDAARPTRRRRTYPEPVEHCDVCRWAAECVDPSPRGRSPEPRRRHHRPGSGGRSTDRGVATLEALGDLAAADGAAARRRSAKGRSLRVREQARIQLEGRRDGATHATSSSSRRRARRSSPSAGWPRCRRRRRATCSSTSRATRTPSTTGSTTCSALLDTDGDVPRHLVARRRRRVLARRRAARLRAADRLHHGPPRRATRRCTSTTTRRTSRPPSSG